MRSSEHNCVQLGGFGIHDFLSSHVDVLSRSVNWRIKMSFLSSSTVEQWLSKDFDNQILLINIVTATKNDLTEKEENS